MTGGSLLTRSFEPHGRCALLVIDIAGFGRVHELAVQQDLRDQLYRLLETCLRDSKIRPEECYAEDRGDGVMIAIPDRYEARMLVSPFLEHLQLGVRTYNRGVVANRRIQLRVALHIGDAHYDGHGLTGTDVTLVFRLNDSRKAKERLRANGAAVAVIVSDEVYQAAIRPARPPIDPDDFDPLAVAEKGLHAPAWVRFMGRRDDPQESADGAGSTVRCPYPGLTAFSEKQGQWFFGRDRLTADLIRRLDEAVQRGGPLIVVGPSGAGKSSLLRAGLLPALARSALPVADSRYWRCLWLTPTAHPMRELSRRLAAVVGIAPERMADVLAAGPETCRARLRDVLWAHGDDPPARLVMIVDQLEELFALCEDKRERHEFVDLLASLAAPADGGPAVALVVYGLRADFYAACADYPSLLAALQDNQLIVGPMSPAELREAIVFPAQDVGLEVEPGLVELLLRELASPEGEAASDGAVGYEAGRLALLAHALRATWQVREGHTLTVAGYRTTGGIQQAVATTADRVFAELNPGRQRTARTLLLRLVKIGDGVEDTRRRLDRADVLNVDGDQSGMRTVLDTLTAGRLLTQTTDTVEITHEALLRAWGRLREWIDAERAGNLVRQELEDAAAAWARNDREPGALYRGRRLDDARGWTAAPREAELSTVAREFLAESLRHERHVAYRRRAGVAAVCVLALVASGLAVAAFQQGSTAREQARVAVAQELVARADSLRGRDPRTALRVGLAAQRIAPDERTRNGLFNTLRSTALVASLTGYSGGVEAVAWSPDGRTLATGSADSSVVLWDVSDRGRPGRLGGRLTGHTDEVEAVAWSPDGRTLATGGADGSVFLWDASDPRRPRRLGGPLTGHDGSVNAVAWSPDGRTLATGSDDETVIMWDITDRSHPRRGAAHTTREGSVYSLAWSPDGRTLALGCDDKAAALWDVSDPRRPRRLGGPLTGHNGSVNTVAWSPDGRTLAGGSDGNTVLFWDLSDRRRPRRLGGPLTGHATSVRSVVWSPDGRTVATGSVDKTVIVWDLTDRGRPRRVGTPLIGSENSVNALAWSPDGRTLASAGEDKAVLLWSLNDQGRPRRFLGAPLIAHMDSVNVVAWSPDGRTVTSGGDDSDVMLWDVSDRDRPRRLGPPLTDHDEAVWSMAWSPDGRGLVTGGNDDTIIVWDLTERDRPRRLGPRLDGQSDGVNALAWSPDGRRLASGGDNGKVHVWDVSDRRRPRLLAAPLSGHTSYVNALAWSPDGRRLASGGDDGKVVLWDVPDRSRPRGLGALPGQSGGVFSVAWSPDGRTLASGSGDNTVLLWDVSDRDRPGVLGEPLTGHEGNVDSVAWSPDGRTLASGSDDNTVLLWDVSDRGRPRPLGEPLTGHNGNVHSVAWSPDGRYLTTAGADRRVLLWDLTGRYELRDQAIARACVAAGGGLTEEDWGRYVSTLPYRPTCP
ncbi:MAG TPA: AAA family ATPase [Streptosporangiaceae bacterium]|nr:AAA family ATPase [Streptosporangiaceae bacterium]